MLEAACTALGVDVLQLDVETAALLNRSFSTSHREGRAEGPAKSVGCWAGTCVQAGSSQPVARWGSGFCSL